MSSLEWIKTAYEALKKANQLEIAEKLMGLREELLEMRETNLGLKKENEELNEKLKYKGKIFYEKGICWITNDEMSSSDTPTPICPQCYQINNYVNRLPIIRRRSVPPFINCQRCNKVFNILND
jgi:hypothetical protein